MVQVSHSDRVRCDSAETAFPQKWSGEVDVHVRVVYVTHTHGLESFQR